jgi:hypothetical protein
MSSVTPRPSPESQSISGSSWQKVNSPKSPPQAIHFARLPSRKANSAGAMANWPRLTDPLPPWVVPKKGLAVRKEGRLFSGQKLN